MSHEMLVIFFATPCFLKVYMQEKVGSKSPQGSLGVKVFSLLNPVCVGVIQIGAF